MSGPKILDSRLLKGSTVLGSGTNDSLNVPRGGLQIDGVSVTASAAQLNGADGPKVAYASAAIAKGRIVYVSGVKSNVPAVTLAGASSPAHAAQYMVTSAIDSGGAIGRIDNVGRVSGLSTADLGAVDGNVYLGSAGTGLMASSVSGPLLQTQMVAQVVTRDSGTGGVLELLIGTPQKWGRGAIQNSAINAGLLDSDAVIGRHILTSAVSAAKIGASAVTQAKIGPQAVSALKMAIAAPNVLVGTGPGGAIEAMATPQITKHTVSALGSGLSAAAARVVVPFPVSLPDNCVVMGAWGKLSAVFNGAVGTFSNAHVDMGLSGAAAIDADGFINGFSVFSGATLGKVNPRDLPVPQALLSNGPVFITSGTARPQIAISATGANLSTLSNGVFTGYIMFMPAPVGSAIT